MTPRRELGDYPTPEALVTQVLSCLRRQGVGWARVIEPSAGSGRFVAGLLAADPPPAQIHAIETQSARAADTVALAAAARVPVHVTRQSLFEIDLGRDLTWNVTGPLLVVGNPPWVTTSALGAMDSGNRPPRSRTRGLARFDACTGASNFDLAEAVALKAVSELADDDPTVALLCKRSTTRRVLVELARRALPVEEAAVFGIDARRWFGVAVAAGLLLLRVGRGGLCREALLFDSLDAEAPSSRLVVEPSGGVVRAAPGARRPATRARRAGGEASTAALRPAPTGAVTRPAAAGAFAAPPRAAQAPLDWRQGLKHDAAAVMELRRTAAGDLVNGLGEIVAVEADRRYPLLKGTDLFHGRDAVDREVVVPQTSLTDETARLAEDAPRLWRYLQSHRHRLDRRRSAVYRRRPPFAIFGIGPYAFAPFKVAVSGLHKEVRFRAVGPAVDGRPVMIDDTCYAASFASPEPAALAVALLDSVRCRADLEPRLFRDAKRPVTKRLLVTLDLAAAWRQGDRRAICARAAAELARLAPDRSPDWARVIEDLCYTGLRLPGAGQHGRPGA